MEYDLVLIEWEDSAQPVPSWQWVEDYYAGGVVVCRSVGWLIHDQDGVIGLAPNIGNIGDGLQVSGVIRIPERCIVKRSVLRRSRAA